MTAITSPTTIIRVGIDALPVVIIALINPDLHIDRNVWCRTSVYHNEFHASPLVAYTSTMSWAPGLVDIGDIPLFLAYPTAPIFIIHGGLVRTALTTAIAIMVFTSPAIEDIFHIT